MRLRKKPWIAAALQEYGDFLLQRPGEEMKGKWQEQFARPGPLQVELGCGKGRFISQMAARDPSVNFIGIEAQQDVIYYAACKVRELGLTNVRLLLFDINHVTDIFAQGEIEHLHVNFCDPWPKKRHAKRRLTHVRFLEMYRGILRPGGWLHFKTDNQELFEFSLEQFAKAGLQVEKVTRDLHAEAWPDNIMTEYEEKFSGLGTKICRCEVRFPESTAE